MGIGSWFDKIDDIIYEPIKLICDLGKEPIKYLDNKRLIELKKLDGEIRRKEKEEEEVFKYQEKVQNLDIEKRREEINIETRKCHVEIDRMINEQEDARRDKLVEALKNYQQELAKASVEIVVEIGGMTIELRERANEMMVERTKNYQEIQNQAMDKATKRIEEINLKFADNERVRIRMEDTVINQMDSIVNVATKFISELSDDIKNINRNIDQLTQIGMENTGKLLQPMGNKLVQGSNTYK